ncbi:MAG: hypothetical protein GYB66_02580 [Chloroflexi bacterium]|nr:hypothetical protein [Chloroflexota bacterium]
MIGEGERIPGSESDNNRLTPGTELVAARQSYQEALEALQAALEPARDPKRETMGFSRRSWGERLVRLPLTLLILLVRIPWLFLQELWHMLREATEDIRLLLGDEKIRLAEAANTERAAVIQNLLLEALWARDYLQQILEQRELLPYQARRNTLQYLVVHDDLLDRLRRLAVDTSDLDPIQMRKAQPTPPAPDAWWWFMDNRRIRRARRFNAFWFIAAIVPALAAIVLITLLTQRLSIDGPDVLAGASALAQLVLGAGSVLAGRELINMFLVDRSSGRSWQGEATFALALVFFGVVVVFYVFAPPAAASVYNWFGQQAINSGNAAEAELYLESATRLDPDPHAANLLEVGCLYQTFGSRDRAQDVYERVLEADSRLLLARHHLAEIYIDRGEYETAQQLANDGINLLASGRTRLVDGDKDDFLPGITSERNADKIEYLLKLSLGRANLAVGDVQAAKQALAEARQLYNQLEEDGVFLTVNVSNAVEIPCTFDRDRLDPYIDITELNLWYLQAKTFDMICANEDDDRDARLAWEAVARSKPNDARQESYVAEARSRLQNYESCQELPENAPESPASPEGEIVSG